MSESVLEFHSETLQLLLANNRSRQLVAGTTSTGTTKHTSTDLLTSEVVVIDTHTARGTTT